MVNRRHLLSGAVGSLLAARAARAEERAQEREQQSWAFALEEVELVVAGLDPAHDGVRVAQLSDLHIGARTPDGRIIAAVDAVNERKPDFTILTGDYVTSRGDPLERVPELLSRLDGDVYAVLGNHDHWTDARTIARDLGKVGFCVLRNQHTVLRVRGRPMTLLGVDDAVTRRADVAATFKGVSTSPAERSSKLVLAHAPPTVDKLPKDLGLACFSGHTHGGQIFIPGVTDSLFARAGQHYVRGQYDVDGNTLYVNRGLGFGKGGGPPRVASDPEVSIFTLRAA